MVSEDVLRGIQEFAEFYFHSAAERINEFARPSIDFTMPEINVIPRRTPQQEARYSTLRERVKRKIFDDTPESNGGKLSVSYDDFEEFSDLAAMLDADAAARFIPGQDRVLLAEDLSEIVPYGHLTHELTHVLRDQIAGENIVEDIVYFEMDGRTRYMERGSLVIPHSASEFVAALNQVILADVCKDEYTFVPEEGKPVDNDLLTYEALEESAVHFALGMERRSKQLLRSLKGSALNPTDRNKASLLRRINAFRKGKFYLALVEGIEKERIDEVHEFFEDVKARYTGKPASSAIINPRKVMGDLTEGNYWKFPDANLLGKLAVNENREELQETWPTVITATPDFLVDTYVGPARERVMGMRKDGLLDVVGSYIMFDVLGRY